jgi:hypothetical protein
MNMILNLHTPLLACMIIFSAAAPVHSDEQAASSEPAAAPDIGLEEAALKGNAEAVRQHIAAGTDLNTRNPMSGATPLISATLFGQNETAMLLIEGGADLEAKNNEGATALHVAAFFCRPEIVKALLAKGADRSARNNMGATALDSVIVPFDQMKPIYDYLQTILGPLGLELDNEYLRETRPKIADILRAE